MKDSDTYMAILDEGREQQFKADITRLARKRFGIGEDQMLSQLRGITDLDRLSGIFDRLLDVKSWQEFVDLP
jgi:hypothetical protein